MKGPYRYKNLKYKIANETEVFFTVEFISDGNEGVTNIAIPGLPNVEIVNKGTARLGLASELLGKKVISFSSLYNVVPEETEIRVAYKINDLLIQPHNNLKSDDERPDIILHISFE